MPPVAFRPACAASEGATLIDIEMCWVDYYARAYGVPPEFVQAVIDVESAWHPYVTSTKGAAGLMQLTPCLPRSHSACPTAFGSKETFAEGLHTLRI